MFNQTVQYKVITATHRNHLTDQINAELAAGWSLHGPTFIETGSDIYVQPMVFQRPTEVGEMALRALRDLLGGSDPGEVLERLSGDIDN